MNIIKNHAAISIAGMALALSFGLVSAASALTSFCTGVAATSSITWTASTSGGVAPVAFLWGNGATTSMQTIAETVGTYSMTIQATDASSSVATSTCSATIAAPVAATTTPSIDVAAQIQALLAQIAALKAQIIQLIQQNTGGTTSPSTTGTTTPSTVGCFNSDRDLSRGDDGDDVKELQQQMAHEDPEVFPPGLITGFFGHKTEEALKHFQEKFGVGATTGFFGPKTRGIFRHHCESEDVEGSDSTASSNSASSTFSVSVNHGEDDNGQDDNHDSHGHRHGDLHDN